ncbi:MAG: hypothetical protein IT210_11315 [Armatimonadetes bacterium]|nr:hypothetical protein [Armatimonadota bacterium]
MDLTKLLWELNDQLREAETAPAREGKSPRLDRATLQEMERLMSHWIELPPEGQRADIEAMEPFGAAGGQLLYPTIRDDLCLPVASKPNRRWTRR